MSKPTTEKKHWRRVIVLLEVDGSYEQAQAVQDAVGEAVDDEFLANIVTPLLRLKEIPSVTWTVKGERWEKGNFYGTEDDILDAEELS